MTDTPAQAPSLAAVTAFYDLGRDAVDGRRQEEYLIWLNRTLRLPVDFTIFLDPRLDPGQIEAKPGDTILQPALEEFRPFAKWRERVHDICASSPRLKTRRDMAVLLPDYGLLVNTKMYMLQQVARTSKSHNLVWLDAGLSRRFDQDLATARLDPGFLARYADAPMALHIAPKFAGPLRRRQLPPSHVGVFDRLITASDMLFATSELDDLVDRLTTMIETEWLPNDLWDNEQTALGYIMIQSPDSQAIGVSKEFCVLAEKLFGGLKRAPRKHSTPWQRLKWHFGKQAPLKPRPH